MLIFTTCIQAEAPKLHTSARASLHVEPGLIGTTIVVRNRPLEKRPIRSTPIVRAASISTEWGVTNGCIGGLRCVMRVGGFQMVESGCESHDWGADAAFASAPDAL